MHGILFCLALMTGVQQDKALPLFERVIRNPTGKNGYELLVKAAEPLADVSAELGAYWGWSPDAYETIERMNLKPDQQEEFKLDLRKRLDSMTLVEVRREGDGREVRQDSSAREAGADLSNPRSGV